MTYNEMISMTKEELKLKIKNLILNGKISYFLEIMNRYNEKYFDESFYDGIKDIAFLDSVLVITKNNKDRIQSTVRFNATADKERILRELIDRIFKLYDEENRMRRELIEYVKNIPNHRMEGFITLEEMGIGQEENKKEIKEIDNKLM